MGTGGFVGGGALYPAGSEQRFEVGLPEVFAILQAQRVLQMLAGGGAEQLADLPVTCVVG
jgi:hypothetical protein